MILNLIYMFFAGYVYVSVEGFFIERFINICRNKNIVLQDLHIENNAYIRFKLLKSDFKELRHIAKNAKCKIKIEKKGEYHLLLIDIEKEKFLQLQF